MLDLGYAKPLSHCPMAAKCTLQGDGISIIIISGGNEVITGGQRNNLVINILLVTYVSLECCPNQ